MLIDEVMLACPETKLILIAPYVLEGSATCNTEEIPDRLARFQKDVAEKAAVAKKLAEKYGLPCFGGSDAHEEQYVGMSATIIDADIRCNNDLIKAVKEKKAIMATGTVREETFKSKSKDHWIGVTAFRLCNRGLAKLIAPYRKLLHMQLPFRV